MLSKGILDIFFQTKSCPPSLVISNTDSCPYILPTDLALCLFKNCAGKDTSRYSKPTLAALPYLYNFQD